ncbi:MAG TPA: hypothetical protein PLP88_09720 [Bacteroidales bacterium]|nr:hypothetical protein [Bacteroidales bacterium]
MKKLIITSVIAIALSLPLVLSSQNEPPHPGGGNAPSGDANRVGGHGPSAPIGSGTIILTLLAAAYGGKKVYNLRKEEKE